MIHTKVAALLVLVLVTSVGVVATQASVSTRVSWTILPFAVMSLEGGAAGDALTIHTPLPSPSAADLTRGYLEVQDAVRLTVRSNTNWAVLVQSLSPTLGTSHDGTFTWTSDALKVGVNGQFVAVGTRPQTIASGGRGEHPLSVDYRATLPVDGLPEGTYETVLLYTITTD